MFVFVVGLVEEHVDSGCSQSIRVVLNFLNQFSNAGAVCLLHNGM